MAKTLSPETLSSHRNLALPIGLLVAVAVGSDLASGCRALTAVFRAIQLGASPFWLGVVAATSGGAYALNLFLIGRVIDRAGRRLIVTVGCLLYAGSLAGHFYATQVWHVVLFAFFFGCSSAVLWPALSAWFCDLAAGDLRRLNRMLGNYNLAWSMGLALGVLLGGVFWQALGPGVFLALAGLQVAAAVALQFVPEAPRAAAACETPPPRAPTLDLTPYLRMGRLANFLAWFASGISLALIPKLMHLLGLPASQAGLALGCYYLAILMFNWLSRTTRRWQFRRWPLLLPAGLILGPVGLLLIAHAAPLFALACYLIGVCAALGGVTSLFYSIQAHPGRRAAGVAMNEMVGAVAGLCGALLGGAVAQRLGAFYGPELALRGAFLLTAALALLTALAQLAVWRVRAPRVLSRDPRPFDRL
jgi:MFS family permease